eukprot:5793224-Amphidinium_carterae.2
MEVLESAMYALQLDPSYMQMSPLHPMLQTARNYVLIDVMATFASMLMPRCTSVASPTSATKGFTGIHKDGALICFHSRLNSAMDIEGFKASCFRIAFQAFNFFPPKPGPFQCRVQSEADAPRPRIDCEG